MTLFHNRTLLSLGMAAWFLGGNAALAFTCEADLFAGATPIFQSGDVLIKEGVFALELKPATDVIYVGWFSDGTPDGYGGVISLEGIAAGRYAIDLSLEARLAVVQHRPFRQIPIEQAKAGSVCPGGSEMIVETGPLSLQISGATASSIMIAIVRLPD